MGAGGVSKEPRRVEGKLVFPPLQQVRGENWVAFPTACKTDFCQGIHEKTGRLAGLGDCSFPEL